MRVKILVNFVVAFIIGVGCLYVLPINNRFLNNNGFYTDLTKLETSVRGWSAIEVVSTESTGTSIEPAIAVDSSGNIFMAWLDYTNYGGSGIDIDIFFKFWNASTKSWALTEVVSTESTSDSYYPDLAIDDSGNVHIVWQDYTDYNSSGTDIDIFYKCKNATTGLWTVTEVVSTESTGDSKFPKIAVDGPGNIYVTWYDLTNYGGSGTDPDIFYKVKGITTHIWTTTTVISTESTAQSYYPAIALDKFKNIHITWHDYTNYNGAGTDWDIFYKVWNFTTTSWSTTTVVSTESSDDSFYPTIATDDSGNVHIAWQDSTDYKSSGSDTDIFYKSWNAGNGLWTTTKVLSTESLDNSKNPQIKIGNSGNVYVVWDDYTDYNNAGTDIDIFFKYKDASSNTWTTTTVVSTDSTENSQNPSIALDGSGHIHTAWEDSTNYGGSDTDTDIFYRQFTPYQASNPLPLTILLVLNPQPIPLYLIILGTSISAGVILAIILIIKKRK